MSFIEYQGTRVTEIPEDPGLYAWYYRPATVSRDTVLRSLTRLLAVEPQITTVVNQRYGIRVISQSLGEIALGAEKQPVPDAVGEAFSRAEPFLEWFFHSAQFANFCRPIYIGIAKNLFERVYNQHYVALIDLWDPGSRVSKYMAANPNASVQQVMDRLGLPHSFALEARVLEISPRDLMVSALVTHKMPASVGPDGEPSSESSTRRALERLLQLLSDPICGRR